MGFLFTFLMIAAATQKFLSLMKFNLPTFSSVSFVVLLSHRKRPLCNRRSQRFTSMFASKSLIVLALTFLVKFCIWREIGVQLNYFACAYPAVLAHLLKNYFSLIELVLAPLLIASLLYGCTFPGVSS